MPGWRGGRKGVCVRVGARAAAAHARARLALRRWRVLASPGVLPQSLSGRDALAHQASPRRQPRGPCEIAALARRRPGRRGPELLASNHVKQQKFCRPPGCAARARPQHLAPHPARRGEHCPARGSDGVCLICMLARPCSSRLADLSLQALGQASTSRKTPLRGAWGGGGRPHRGKRRGGGCEQGGGGRHTGKRQGAGRSKCMKKSNQ